MEHVELLVLLVSLEAEAVTAIDAARRLQVDAEPTAKRLVDLADSGLVTRDGPPGNERFRYQPKDLSLKQATEQLMESYRTRPVSLIRVVYERPPEAAQRFADAFRLRKE